MNSEMYQAANGYLRQLGYTLAMDKMNLKKVAESTATDEEYSKAYAHMIGHVNSAADVFAEIVRESPDDSGNENVRHALATYVESLLANYRR